MANYFPIIPEQIFKSKYWMLVPDLLILTSIITMMSIFRSQADLVLLSYWLIIAVYFVVTKRFHSLLHLFLSTIVAIIWVYIARTNYGYNHIYWTVFGMNLLPLMAWSLGLLAVVELFNYIRFRKKLFNFLLFVPLFWISLIIIESYAYHVIVIRDTMSGNTIGLPFCNCIHAPNWMRAVYFTMGPVYYAITLFADRALDRYHPGLPKKD